MGNFNLPKKVARLIVLQRIELLSPFLAKIRKLFGRYFFSNFITRFFLDPKIIREKYYKIMADEFSIIEIFIDSNDKIFLSIGIKFHNLLFYSSAEDKQKLRKFVYFKFKSFFCYCSFFYFTICFFFS